MNDIPLIALCVSSVLSVVAIVVSALSLSFSWRAQHHTQIVSYEQRKQEVRQSFFEGQLMLGEINTELNRAIPLSGDAGWPNASQIAEVAVLRHRCQNFLKNVVERLPSSPSTQARLKLEELGGEAILLNKDIQVMLKNVRDTNQAIEKIQRELPK
jgi:hypothetical protein